MSHTAVVAASAGAPLGERFSALSAALALGERTRDAGGHALVVLDDISCMVWLLGMPLCAARPALCHGAQLLVVLRWLALTTRACCGPPMAVAAFQQKICQTGHGSQQYMSGLATKACTRRPGCT